MNLPQNLVARDLFMQQNSGGPGKKQTIKIEENATFK
jgi:hypothetical protein